MERSIFDYFKEFGHANLPLSLYRFPPDHFVFSFLFDHGSSLLPVILVAANYYSRMVVDDFKELIRIFTCHMNSTSNAHCIFPKFPFDPGATLFIICICPGGCLQVFTLQPEASNWETSNIFHVHGSNIVDSKGECIFLEKDALCFAHCNVKYYDDHLWTPFDSADTLQLQRLISLRFDPMREANAISSCFLVSRVIMSEVELDNCGQLCFSLLLLIVVTKVFQQQLDFKVLTTCSPVMVEFIQFELLNDYWIRYFRNPTDVVFDDALVVALYHNNLDVIGQIHRERSAQIRHGTNILDCIWNMSKLVVSINDTKNVDTPLVSQNKEANSRNCIAWVIDMSLHRDTTSFLIPLANKEYLVTKGYIAPKGHMKLLVSVISHIYNVEIMFLESLDLLKAEGWSRPVIIWSNVLLIGKVVRELPTRASNLLMLVYIASLIAPMRIITMISIWYYLNVEDKVLIGAEGIAMNGPRPVLT
ncbi:hypothetical protein RDI58_025113 [Solanum bulbocastanum]|uniref:Uncharacterized protein n=1 Tax=Solanum bulbocastanum TaxID=147425 RepID=A0AAN8T0Y3_SOLBU